MIYNQTLLSGYGPSIAQSNFRSLTKYCDFVASGKIDRRFDSEPVFKVITLSRSRIYDSTRTITMAESSDTRYTVAKLNNSNYQIWKFKVKMLLIREDTWTVVQGDTPDPVPDDWQRKDEKAQCTISLTVEDNQPVHICNCTSAKDMWKQLQKVHERSNLSSKMYLRKKLYKMRLQDDQNMQEYISAVLRLVEQLRGVGEEVSDQQVATLFLCGLPDEYETLITARDEDELTLEYVKNKLVDAYKRKKDNEADSTESRTESAMYSGKIRRHSHMNNRHKRN